MGVYKWWIAASVFTAAVTYSIYAILLLLPPPPLASAARPGVRLLLPPAGGGGGTPLAAAGLLRDGCELPWSNVAAGAGGGNGSLGVAAGAGGYAGRDGLTLPLPPAGAGDANGIWFELGPAAAAAAAAAGGAAGKVALAAP